MEQRLRSALILTRDGGVDPVAAPSGQSLHEEQRPLRAGRAAPATPEPVRQRPLVHAGVDEQPLADRAEVRLALNRLRLLPGAVERGQQERDQDRNDPDDDEQFDQGKAEAGRLTSHGELLTEARRTSIKTWLRSPVEGASVDGMVGAGERRCET